MKAPVLLVSDVPARFDVLRRSALSGREVHIWMPERMDAPAWASAVHGDPVASRTYAELSAEDLLAVVDIVDGRRASRVATAIRRALPSAPVLAIVRGAERRRSGNRGRITWIDEGELLADAIDLLLKRVQDRKRVEGLRQSLRGSDHCAFLIQHDPDPDAIASALALRVTLDLDAVHSPIITCGRVTRPENRRMLAELSETVQHVSGRSLATLGPLILVDVQPPYFNMPLPNVAAVIDHHPTTGRYRARYRDIRTSYGASATMAAEYLLTCGPAALTRQLATALLYGIITDTKSLSRPTSDEDLQMFAQLFPLADQAVLRRIQHPSYQPGTLHRFGRALETARVRNGLAYVHLGRLPMDQEHIVAQLSEFCLGMAGAEVSAVSGVFGGRLVMSTRALNADARLGARLRLLFGRYGSAGGHPVMAKAVIELVAWKEEHPYSDDAELERTMRSAMRKAGIGARKRR
ncbi:MAG: DHH family phosphoesterase [Gemmatimonadaceae bacterium]